MNVRRTSGEKYHHRQLLISVCGRLKPFSAVRGAFPNEIYTEILRYVDPATRLACRNVSRAFRDFASEVFCMSDDLNLITQTAPLQPAFYHRKHGYLGSFEYSGLPPSKETLRWHPVIGLCNGTSSFLPFCSLQWGSIPYDVQQGLATGVDSDTEALSQPKFLRSEIVDSEHTHVFYVKRTRQRQDSSSHLKYNYSVIERLLPTQDIVATSRDVMGLYCTVFFCPASLFGSVTNSSNHHWRRSKSLEQIGVALSNTCIYIGARDCPESGFKLPYGLAWAKPPLEDTAEGWRKTTEEAMDFAATEFTKYQHTARIQGKDIK
jgi:hypothetical protein